MSTKKSSVEGDFELEDVAVVTPSADVEKKKPVTVIAPRLQAAAAAPKKEKTFSFEQWAKLRNRPNRHLGGLRAFLGDKAKNKYSLAIWDELLKAY